MFTAKSSILITSSLLIGGSSLLIYEFKKPRKIKAIAEWRGIKLAKENDDFTWKALFFEKQKILKEKKVIDQKALKDHCLNLYKQKPDQEDKLLSETEKFCSDAFISRKARIKAGGFDEKNFLNEEIDFKVAFTINRYTEKFRNLLSEFSGKSYTDETDSKDVWKDYQIFCNTKLEENKDSDLEIIKKVCEKKGFKTAKEKIEKDGRSLSNKDDFDKKFEEIQKLTDSQGSTLLEDIEEKPLNDWNKLKKDKEVFKNKLNEWCEKQKNKELWETNFYPNIYSKFKTRCTK